MFGKVPRNEAMTIENQVPVENTDTGCDPSKQLVKQSRTPGW